MARNHARIYVRIWQDEDFLDLRPSQQRLYLFLLSQPNMTHLGVLPLTLHRWGRKAQAYSGDDLRDDLAALEEAGFVVVDEAEEELLVRSLVRNDGIYKQPNVLRAGISTAAAISSDRIKRALAAEVERLDLSDISTEPAKRSGDPTARELVESLLDDLMDALETPPEDPSPKGSGKGSPKGSENPSLGVPATHPDTPYACAPARPLVLSPTPTPTSSEVRAPQARFDEWWSAYPRKKGKGAARTAYAKALRHTTAEVLLDAVLRYRDDPTRAPDFTCYPATWLNEQRWDDEGPVRPQSLNRSEERTASHLALVERVAQAEGRHYRQPELGA